MTNQNDGHRIHGCIHVKGITIHPERFPADDQYPFNLEVLRQTRHVDLDSPVVFFAGENGSGKSTLLEAIARRASIHIWQGFQRARYHRSRYEKALSNFISLEWRDGIEPGAFFASEIFKNFSQLIDEWATSDPGVLRYFGDHSLMSRSHGESHMAYFRNRFRLRGLYLLDEPENALSPRSQIELLKLLESPLPEAQFIIATHSPILLSLRGARILSFDTAPLSWIAYEETEHFKAFSEFFSRMKQESDRSGD